MRRTVAWGLAAALLIALPAAAQDASKKVNVNVGGSYVISSGKVRDSLGDGYGLNVGVWVNILPPIALQAEFNYIGMGQKQVQMPVSGDPGGAGATQRPFYGSMDMGYGNVNVVFRPDVAWRAKPYVLGGVGGYHRTVDITTPSAGYVPGFCDPWWFYCQPGGWVAIDRVVASRGSWDYGVDFGGGVNIGVTENASIFVEARYHYIWGPRVYDNAGTYYGRANGKFLPITVGVRF